MSAAPLPDDWRLVGCMGVSPLIRPLRGHLLPQGEKGRVWPGRRVNGAPAVVVVEGKWLISGGQPAGVFEEALRGMAGEGED